MAHNAFLLYNDFYDLFARLSVKEKGYLIQAILDFAVKEVDSEEHLSPAAGMAYTIIKLKLARDREKYEARCAKARESGRMGGRPSKKTDSLAARTNVRGADNAAFSENRTNGHGKQSEPSPGIEEALSEPRTNVLFAQDAPAQEAPTRSAAKAAAAGIPAPSACDCAARERMFESEVDLPGAQAGAGAGAADGGEASGAPAARTNIRTNVWKGVRANTCRANNAPARSSRSLGEVLAQEREDGASATRTNVRGADNAAFSESRTNGHGTQSEPSPEISDETTPPAGRRQGDELDDGFAAFWNAYPRKMKISEARRAWMDLNPDAALREKIMNSLKEYCDCPQWHKNGGRYIPFPQKWLAERRFLVRPQDVARADAAPESAPKKSAAGGLSRAGQMPAWRQPASRPKTCDHRGECFTRLDPDNYVEALFLKALARSDKVLDEVWEKEKAREADPREN